MVFLTRILAKYKPHWYVTDPHHFTSDKRAFRRLQSLELTKSFFGRHRNVFKIAKNRWLYSLHISFEDRQERTRKMRDIYSQRIWAGLQEHRFPYKYFLGVLPRAGIELDRRVLAHLALWEPRTFAALIDVCRAHVTEKPVGAVHDGVKKPEGVITRDML